MFVFDTRYATLTNRVIMSIKFTIRMNRTKEPKVEIFRVEENTIDEKKTRKNIMLGRLPDLTEKTISEFSEKNQLSEYERFTLENYASQLTFNKNDLNNSFDVFHRDILYMSEAYQEALFKLWKLAKENNIHFCPADIMQKTLMLKAKTLERKLNALKKEPVNILEAIGIDIKPPEDDESLKKVRITCRKLFRLLLNTGHTKEKIAHDFNEIAKSYRKKEVLKSHYLQDLASHIRRLPFWYNTVAIDLLVKYGKNPAETLSVEAIVENWLRLRKDRLSPEEAMSQLKKTFDFQPEKEAFLRSAVSNEYAKGLAIDNL